MSALRLGRSSVRFLHNYSGARVSCLGLAPCYLRQHGPQQAQWLGAIIGSARGYADKPVARPKQHTGRAPARKPRASGTAATKKTTSTKKTSGKSPAKKATKKAAKKPVKKAAKPKKELTPEQLTRKEQKVQVAKLREYKAQSLKKEEPKPSLDSAWKVYFSEQQKTAPKSGPQTIGERGAYVKEIAARYKNFSPAELEHYNHVANTNKVAAAEEHRKWVSALSALAVKEANLARQRLTALGIKGYTRQIQDDRLVTRPLQSYTLFYKSRFDSGDFKGMKVTEAATLASREWKELPQSEVQEFQQQAEQDRQRYYKEHKEVYGFEPVGRSGKAKAVPT